MATSSHESQVPWSSPVSSSTTVNCGVVERQPPEVLSERSYDRRAQGSHRAAPCEGSPQSVQSPFARRLA